MRNFDRLGQRLGLHLAEYEKPQMTMAWAISREPDHGFTSITGKLFAGIMRFADVPSELLHELALERNGDLSQLAKELAEIMPRLDDDTRKTIALNSSGDMTGPMPKGWQKGYHRALFRALKLEEGSIRKSVYGVWPMRLKRVIC